MLIIIIILIISKLYYGFTLFWFIYGNLSYRSKISKTNNEPVSIIIAIRNGEKSLPQLLESLKQQQYNGKMEFILVDDESEDNTSILIQKAAKTDSRFKYVTSINGNNLLNHKKRALDAGIELAKYEWLLFTDVDCTIKKTWVNGMAKYFNDKIDYVIGFSSVKTGNKLVTLFQSIDFFMLMISARGSTLIGNPWACSGQNQAYRKTLFNKIGGFSKIANQLQGDDSLFLQLCRKKLSINIEFADSPECQTNSRQEVSWISFFKQRIRWAGDAKTMWQFNKPFFMMIITAFLLPLMIMITTFIELFYNAQYYNVLIIIILLHFFIELTLYTIGTKKLSKPFHLLHFSLWFIIHIPYVVLMGIGSFFSNKLNWKGR